jgi:flagellar M-ring protein FliF
MKQGLIQVVNQLTAVWKQLGFNQKVTVALATLGVVAGLIAITFFSGRTSYSLLYGRLDEAEAARVVAALDDAKVAYQVRGPGTIYVATDQVYPMRMQLAAKGIPRGDGVGFEIFDKPNFGISDFVQRANFKRAIEGELARTIAQLDSIEAARVQVVIPENRLITDSQRRPTASVFVRVRGQAQLAGSEVNSIRFLVANAVEGLVPNQVSVIDNMGNVLSENQEDNSVAGISNNQLRARRELEQYLSRKAEDMLNRVLGPGQAVVRVSADINWNTTTRYEEKYDPETQVVRTAVINDEEVVSSTVSGGGVPGVGSNTPAETNAVATTTTGTGIPQNSTRTKKKVTNNQYEVDRTVSSFLEREGAIQRLSAAVFIAARFEGTGPTRKALPRTAEELQSLQRNVQNALGIQEGESGRGDEITLEEIPFNDQPLVDLTQQLDRQQTRQFWTDLGWQLLYPALGIAVLVGFWRAFKRTRSDDLTLGLPLDELVLKTNGHGSEGNGHLLPLRQNEPRTVTVEVLNQLIRENPSNMSQAVRNWLTRGKPVK